MSRCGGLRLRRWSSIDPDTPVWSGEKLRQRRPWTSNWLTSSGGSTKGQSHRRLALGQQCPKPCIEVPRGDRAPMTPLSVRETHNSTSRWQSAAADDKRQPVIPPSEGWFRNVAAGDGRRRQMPRTTLIRQRSKPSLHVEIHGSIWQMERAGGTRLPNALQ